MIALGAVICRAGAWASVELFGRAISVGGILLFSPP
jgi:hypothetical protein